MLIYLGLGSNVGDREIHLRNAIQSLDRLGVTVLRSASIYLTEPRDFESQPWFLNTVIEAETTLTVHDLLRACLGFEVEAGRYRDSSKGPRPIDIDILFFGTQTFDEPGLIVPHPRYAERRFVLVPLVELVPDLRDPVRHLTTRELLRQCSDPGVVRFYAPALL
jgi:2-amino-4-hydroxy-6-hydroxymethyldihydropteridine diphosphokinase